MNKLIIALLIIAQSMFSYSQKINGEYWNKQYFMKFTKDSIVNFHLFTTGGLAYPIKGKGNYQIKGNLLYIKSKHDDTIPPSTYKVLSSLDNGNTLIISVKDINGKPIHNVNVIVSDKKNNYLFGGSSDKEGKYTVVSNPDCDSIAFSLIGHDDLKIPFSEIKGKNIEITMPDYIVYDNEVLVYYVYVNESKKLILEGPLAEKYIKLIQRKKIKEYNKMKSKDYFAPAVLEFYKK